MIYCQVESSTFEPGPGRSKATTRITSRAPHTHLTKVDRACLRQFGISRLHWNNKIRDMTPLFNTDDQHLRRALHIDLVVHQRISPTKSTRIDQIAFSGRRSQFELARGYPQRRSRQLNEGKKTTSKPTNARNSMLVHILATPIPQPLPPSSVPRSHPHPLWRRHALDPHQHRTQRKICICHLLPHNHRPIAVPRRRVLIQHPRQKIKLLLHLCPRLLSLLLTRSEPRTRPKMLPTPLPELAQRHRRHCHQ